MILKTESKDEGIILIITSFIQLNNFLSYFIKKKLLGKKKIYLAIFSDEIPENLILNLKKFIERFTIVEVVDIRRKSVIFNQKLSNYKIFKHFFYYFFVLKKILEIKKTFIIPFIAIYTKMQLPILLIIIFFSPLKIFFMEDGFNNYISHRKNRKKTILIYLLKKILISKKIDTCILQLAKSRKDYYGLLSEPFFNKEHYFDNKEIFKKFLEDNFEKDISFTPKCILIATRHAPHNFEYFKKLYIDTLIEINKKYSYSPDQILFIPHPREKSDYLKELEKSLYNYSNIKGISTITVENYLSQKNLETVIGTFSSSLYYAKSIFNKKHVYYIDFLRHPNENDEILDKYVSIFNSLDIKNFFN